MAESLGCTLDELGDRISSAEYSLRLYYRDLYGRRTPTVLLAKLLALTFNLYRPEDRAPMTEDDLLPRLVDELSRPAAPASAPAATGADLRAFLAELN